VDFPAKRPWITPVDYTSGLHKWITPGMDVFTRAMFGRLTDVRSRALLLGMTQGLG